jgi:hypothetical protein
VYGWEFLRVGHGSGMLPNGGSYVSLVSPNGCNDARVVDYTMILQTMEWGLSRCFKDSHPPFTVAAQNASFRLAPQLLSRLQQSQTRTSTLATATPQLPLQLFARRTRLYQDDLVDPVYDVPLAERPNRYFEQVPGVVVGADGST